MVVTPAVTEVARIAWSPAAQATFRRLHVGGARPVAVDGLLREWNAPARWTWAWLRARFARRKVSVSVDEDGVCSNRRYVPLTFGAFLRRMHDGRHYLAEVHLPTVFPELMADLCQPAVVPPGAALPSRHPNAWFSGAGISKGLHYDRADNVLCQVRGRKQVWLISPDQSEAMYPDLGSSHPHNSRVRTPLAPDLQRYPRFAEVAMHAVELSPGTALYIPPGWWHFTRAATPSISVNYWWVE